jgi:hypothetical protein
MKKATATINELFTWYMGKDWSQDWQTTNTMTVDGCHAQVVDYYGEKTLKDLRENTKETVEVSGKLDNQGTWDLEFDLKGKHYKMSASAFFGEEGY